MAASILDHIHLDTSDPPTTTYAAAQDTWNSAPAVAVVHERGVTGVLHTHRLLSGVNPVVFCADTMVLLLSLAQMLVVKALAGKTIYFVSNYHDDDEDGAGSLKAWSAGSVYVKRGVLALSAGSIMNLDPMGDWWSVHIEIVDSGTVT